MRPLWKGSISFGLVNVPVNLYSATENHDLELHQVHDEDGGRIHYQRCCKICGKIVPYDHIEKAYEDGEQTVILSGQDLASLPAERSREIEVVEFVPNNQVDVIRYGRSYFLEPASDSPRAYILLRHTLQESDRTAIVHFSLRQKSRLGALHVHGEILLLHSLLWDDEVRNANFPVLHQNINISPKERELSATLINSFAGDFKPNTFTDEYQKQLHELIENKLQQEGSVTNAETTDAEESGGEVLDLLEALRQSVEKNRKKIS
jgi:DNA end-binding protein Ku